MAALFFLYSPSLLYHGGSALEASPFRCCIACAMVATRCFCAYAFGIRCLSAASRFESPFLCRPWLATVAFCPLFALSGVALLQVLSCKVLGPEFRIGNVLLHAWQLAFCFMRFFLVNSLALSYRRLVRTFQPDDSICCLEGFGILPAESSELGSYCNAVLKV